MSKNNPVESTSVTLYEQGFINIHFGRRHSTRAHYPSHASHARYSRLQAKIGAGFNLSIWGRPSSYGGNLAPAADSAAEPVTGRADLGLSAANASAASLPTE